MPRSRYQRRLSTFLIAAALVLLTVAVAEACPTCKDGIADADPAAQRMAAGYFYSILFMMSAPFILLGTFGSFEYLSIRRARAAQASQEAGEL